MVFTRSIRRKLVLGLMFVCLMQGAFTLNGMSGLASYRRMVRNLEVGISEAPRRADLLAALAELLTPLASENPSFHSDVPQVRQVRAEKFRVQLRTARGNLVTFRKQVQGATSSSHRPFEDDQHLMKQMGKIESQLDDLEPIGEQLADADRDGHAGWAIFTMVRKLIEDLHEVPEYTERIHETLENAKADYQWHQRWVVISGIGGLAVMIGLGVYGYRWFAVPIRQLHYGALRVAGGEFDFRLNVDSEDEICSLAQAFNKMTRRFQSETQNREKLVEERSRQLVQSERLAGVGFLSAGVAHEINNPLQVILSMAEAVESRLREQLPADFPDGPLIYEYLRTIISEADRSQKITHKLLDFAHGGDGRRNLYDLTAIAHDVADMLGHLGRYRDRPIRVNRHDPCEVEISGDEIKQVVLNLVANALDASPSGSEVAINLQTFPDLVELSVVDSGAGMTAETLTHLFEPGFTTKDVGKGTGLGLSISHRIVADHRGTLEARSEGPGKGSTFRMILPLKAAARRVA